MIDYNAFRNTIVPVIYECDTVNGQQVVNCEYSGETKIYSGNFEFVSINYSREHVLPRSWMPTGGETNTPEGADYHNLALTNLNQENSQRSNIPFGEVVHPNYTYLECQSGLNSNQQSVFEPRDAFKGNAARAIFYQIITYNGLSGIGELIIC